MKDGKTRSCPPEGAVDGSKATSWFPATKQRKSQSVVWQYSFTEPKVVTQLIMDFGYAGALDKVLVHGNENCSGKLFVNDVANQLSIRTSNNLENPVNFRDAEVRFDVEPKKLKAYRCFAVNLTTWEEKYVGIREVEFNEGRF